MGRCKATTPYSADLQLKNYQQLLFVLDTQEYRYKQQQH